jgi:hypothetical protein
MPVNNEPDSIGILALAARERKSRVKHYNTTFYAAFQLIVVVN